MKHDEPVDSVRGNENIFPDNLHRGPTVAEFLWLAFVIVDLWIVAGEADVVRQRVEPNVSNEIFIERQFDSPVEPRFGTRNAEITSQSLNRVSQFSLTKIGNDCVFAIVEVTKQPIFVLTEFEI